MESNQGEIEKEKFKKENEVHGSSNVETFSSRFCEKCKKKIQADSKFPFCKECFESLPKEKQAELKKTYWIKKIFFLFSYILIILPFFLLFRSTDISNLILFLVLLISGVLFILFLEKKYPQYIPDDEG